MEKCTYTMKDAKNISAELLEKGIEAESNKYQTIMLALKYGMPNEQKDCLMRAASKLSDSELLEVFASQLAEIDGEMIEKMCHDPENIAAYREEFYKARYLPAKSAVYKEVFEEFHEKWKAELDRTVKQEEMMSNTFDFLKEQLDKREAEIESLKKELEEERAARMQEEVSEPEEQEPILEEVQELMPEPEAGLSEKEEINRPNLPEASGVTSFFKKLLPAKDDYAVLLKLYERLSMEQMEVVVSGYEQGLSLAEIKKYAKEKYSAEKMEKMKELLLKNKNVKKMMKND